MKIHELVLNEARPYLAGQAEPFIARQCNVHLNIPLESLTLADLPKLAWWVRISASLVISREKAEALAQKILAIAN